MFHEYSYKARNGATAKLAAWKGHSMFFLALKMVVNYLIDLLPIGSSLRLLP